MSVLITPAQVREFLHYDPDTGVFTRRISRGRWRSGTIAGSSHSEGYWMIRLNGASCLAHRLAWIYMTGEWPKADIDHINMIRSDNRIANLREASRSENNANTGHRKSNKTGLKGASFESFTGRYKAQIKKGGVLHTIGRFDTPEEAHKAYQIKAAELFGQFARTTNPEKITHYEGATA